MRVSTLLAFHDQNRSSLSLRDNLGDGYLINHNPVYRSIRQRLLSEGFTLSSKQMDRYLAMPLTQLPTLLQKKIIPYVPNVAVLRDVEKKSPGFFDIRHLPPLRSNVIHHESSHAIAHRIRLRTVGRIEPRSLRDQQNLLIAYYLEESFANASESLLSVFSDGSTHDYFLSMNSYLVEGKKTRTTYSRFLDLYGFETLLRMMILSFFHANLIRPRVSASRLNQLIALSLNEDRSLEGIKTPLFRSIFESAQQLDSSFTVKTNFFCLALLGLKNPIETLRPVDPLKEFQHEESSFREFLDELGDAWTLIEAKSIQNSIFLKLNARL